MWHIEALDSTASIATRGAGNARLLAGRCRPDATVYAFAQNDTPGEKWMGAIAAACGCKCVHVATPAPHKDPNDWAKAGAKRQEFQAAMAAAQVVSPAPDLHAAPPRNVSKSTIGLPEEDGADAAPAPFPIDCLPPAMALMVRAVADTLRVPDALLGTMALALVAASIGKGLALDWRPGKAPTPANLFVVPSAESGSGKSECYKLLSGDDVKVDRQGREGVRLANPCMTLLWALQPDALDMLLGEVTLQQGGFLARCLLAHTHAEPQPIDGSEHGVTDATRARWDSLIRDLLVNFRQPVTLPLALTKLDPPTTKVIDEEF